jgi:hypothetical protein
MLIVFDVRPDQIHAASRTRLSSVILDAMTMESLGRGGQGLETEAAPQ